MATPLRKIDSVLGVPYVTRLFPPPDNCIYRYFEGADNYPFEPNATQHSPQNAWWLAECSLLTYCEEKEVNRTLAELCNGQKFTLTWLDAPETNTQGFAFEMADYVIIAFRGTEFPRPTSVLKSPSEIRDIVDDIQTDIQRLPPTKITHGAPVFDIPVHPGFSAALQNVWAQIQAVITHASNKPIWLCGHSLGGAIATLLAYQIPERVAGLYTFGSPCAGSSAFVEDFNTKKHLGEKTYRYVHGNDTVANGLPLLGMDYHHVGQLKQLDAGLRRGVMAQIVNLAIVHTIKLNQFDHAPIIYSYECWNAIPA
ncbi:MAG: lipase family protein [Methyloglobulus sp.]|nr:lipase family protein [Methyloglobulus sp.]